MTEPASWYVLWFLHSHRLDFMICGYFITRCDDVIHSDFTKCFQRNTFSYTVYKCKHGLFWSSFTHCIPLALKFVLKTFEWRLSKWPKALKTHQILQKWQQDASAIYSSWFLFNCLWQDCLLEAYFWVRPIKSAYREGEVCGYHGDHKESLAAALVFILIYVVYTSKPWSA